MILNSVFVPLEISRTLRLTMMMVSLLSIPCQLAVSALTPLERQCVRQPMSLLAVACGVLRTYTVHWLGRSKNEFSSWAMGHGPFVCFLGDRFFLISCIEHALNMFARAARSQAAKKFGTVVTVRRWVRGAPRRADVSFSTAEEMDAAISGLEGKERYGAERHRETLCQYMGVSENSVPLHPMVNDHYPY